MLSKTKLQWNVRLLLLLVCVMLCFAVYRWCCVEPSILTTLYVERQMRWNHLKHCLVETLSTQSWYI